MLKIGIFGAGSFGMALARILKNNGNDVEIWTRHSDKLDQYARTGVFPMLNNMPIPPGISFERHLERLCLNKDVLICAVPSVYVRQTICESAPYIPSGQIIVSVAKGIERDTLLLPTDIIEDELKKCRGDLFEVNTVALSGPSHAEEVARDLPTTVVSASDDPVVARFVQGVFAGTCIRVYTNPDKKGVELCGALKNIIALASGISEGLGYGDNTKAALITRGLAEMWRLGSGMGCSLETFAGLAGLGDLVCTCTSKNSRNNRCGILIGEGLAPMDAKNKIGMAVEGINTLPAAIKLKQKYDVQMPITQTTDAVIYHNMNPKEAVNILMSRERKNEVW